MTRSPSASVCLMIEVYSKINTPYRICFAVRGDFLLRIPVWFASEEVGQATVERQGMYYLLSCTVNNLSGTMPELELHSHLGTVKCGKCVPREGGAVLTKRVPIKQWDAETGTICIRRDREMRGFTRVQDLRHAYFDPATGTVLVRTDREAPARRDNDQSP